MSGTIEPVSCASGGLRFFETSSQPAQPLLDVRRGDDGRWRRTVVVHIVSFGAMEYIGADLLLAMFGLAMAISQGPKSPLDYSVFSASAAAVLVGRASMRP